MFMRLRNQRGDTIVEVLIAISIVSLTLAGAYASVSRSTNATRTAQERGEALKWAETQVEQLKAADTAAIPNLSTFCYTTGFQPSPTVPCQSGTIPYNATITKDNRHPGSFSVIVTWSGLGTSANNTVELDYIK